jgi:3-phytase
MSLLLPSMDPNITRFRQAICRQTAWTRLALVFLLLTAAAVHCAAADRARIATFNLSLYGEQAGEVLARLRTGSDSQAQHLAEIIQRTRPDVLLLNEIDADPTGEVLQTFADKYLGVPQHASQSPAGPAKPIKFEHQFTAPVNTGRHSGYDLDRSGAVSPTEGTEAYAADCWGYGRYAGQYGMAILSNFPIDRDATRTFRTFRWKDMPGALIPDDPTTARLADWYPLAALEEFPLSSKSHWDVPVLIGGRRIHLLACHPTPPVYDDAEDRNGRRNHDEIRFWADYVAGSGPSAYIYDDKGIRGGLGAVAKDSRDAAAEGPTLQPQARKLQSTSFIILGDLNGDPFDGDGPEGVKRLLDSPPGLKYPPPESPGAQEQARLQGGANNRHQGPPEQDTCDPADNPGPGNLRIDYVLPSADLRVARAGVFWPSSDGPLFPLVGVHPFPSSDHRLVWVDIESGNSQPAVD